MFSKKADTDKFLIKSSFGEFICLADETLLDAARKNNAYIPHRCGLGTCGICKTEIDGEVVLACKFKPSSDCELNYREYANNH